MNISELIESYKQALIDVEREMDEAPAVSIERLQLSRKRAGLVFILESLRDELSWTGGSDPADDAGIRRAAG